MKLFCTGHGFFYEMTNLCFLFFPGERVERAQESDLYGESFVLTRLKKTNSGAIALCVLRTGGKTTAAHEHLSAAKSSDAKACELALGRAFYHAGARLCGFCPPWGILTGIRPVKLLRELIAAGRSPAQARRYLREACLVSEEKVNLLFETEKLETAVIQSSGPRSCSLYISIPFCPSRCAYCSFVSHDIEKAMRLVPEYVRLLCLELAETAKTIKTLGLRLETVYMGGGTPTSLSAEQLRMIFDTVKEHYDLSCVREYTVEAGRPDTLSPDKLAAIHDAGATRISINPQTMRDDILRAVGRKHTVQDILDAFALARGAGIPSVNMDLIAGLPGDDSTGFRQTVEKVLALRPEAVTVHTLAMKRSSRLVVSGAASYDARGSEVEQMLAVGETLLRAAGYHPYYLYRQRNMAGNLENVGWCLEGYEGLYNIFIMDETHSILSCGAGGVTKLRQPGGTKIERVFNFKYPYEYISRFSQILDKKKQVLSYYDEFDKQTENPGLSGHPAGKNPAGSLF